MSEGIIMDDLEQDTGNPGSPGQGLASGTSRAETRGR